MLLWLTLSAASRIMTTGAAKIEVLAPKSFNALNISNLRILWLIVDIDLRICLWAFHPALSCYNGAIVGIVI